MKRTETRTVEVVSVRQLRRNEAVRVEIQAGETVVIIERAANPKKLPES